MTERMVGGTIHAEDVRAGDLIETQAYESVIRVSRVDQASKMMLVRLHGINGECHVLERRSEVTLRGTMKVETPLITARHAVIIGDELLGHIHYDGPDAPDAPPWKVIPAGQRMWEERFDSQDQAVRWFMERAEGTRS